MRCFLQLVCIFRCLGPSLGILAFPAVNIYIFRPGIRCQEGTCKKNYRRNLCFVCFLYFLEGPSGRGVLRASPAKPGRKSGPNPSGRGVLRASPAKPGRKSGPTQVGESSWGPARRSLDGKVAQTRAGEGSWGPARRGPAKPGARSPRDHRRKFVSWFLRNSKTFSLRMFLWNSKHFSQNFIRISQIVLGMSQNCLTPEFLNKKHINFGQGLKFLKFGQGNRGLNQQNLWKTEETIRKKRGNKNDQKIRNRDPYFLFKIFWFNTFSVF